jgi:hypothetical protein
MRFQSGERLSKKEQPRISADKGRSERKNSFLVSDQRLSA